MGCCLKLNKVIWNVLSHELGLDVRFQSFFEAVASLWLIEVRDLVSQLGEVCNVLLHRCCLSDVSQLGSGQLFFINLLELAGECGLEVIPVCRLRSRLDL